MTTLPDQWRHFPKPPAVICSTPADENLQGRQVGGIIPQLMSVVQGIRAGTPDIFLVIAISLMPFSIHLSACPHCDALHRVQRLPCGRSALCTRCGLALYHSRFVGVERPLAFALTGLFLFVIANSHPLLTLELGGRIQTSTLWEGVTALSEAGLWLLPPLVFCTSLLFPLLLLVGMLYLLLPLKFDRPAGRHAAWVLRAINHATPWSMTGIYTLGVMVALVKLRDMATVTPGMALYAFFGLLLTTIAAQLSLDARTRRLMLEPVGRKTGYPLLSLRTQGLAAAPPATALQAGWVRCPHCTLLVGIPTHPGPPCDCPHCHAPLHPRKPASLSRTWALILAAALFYIPANLLPIMTVVRFGQGAPDTILSGIQHLMESGLWPLALLILFASMIVPLMKLGILTFLLLSVHYRSRWRPRDRTHLYRALELFGHWSMVDIFLLSILTALVQLGTLSTIEPGDGATFFGVVVVLTMLATKSFDPRLMWDVMESTDG
ncbi:MAG: paraquat-inducible protein A [Magnetococcus sp. MYC-9]